MDLPQKPGYLNKRDIKKMCGSFLCSNNDQSELILGDNEKDKDGLVSIDDLINLLIQNRRNLY